MSEDRPMRRILVPNHSDDQTKEDEIDMGCSKHGRAEMVKCIQNFGTKT
jgi:hypothetical protein